MPAKMRPCVLLTLSAFFGSGCAVILGDPFDVPARAGDDTRAVATDAMPPETSPDAGEDKNKGKDAGRPKSPQPDAGAPDRPTSGEEPDEPDAGDEGPPRELEPVVVYYAYDDKQHAERLAELQDAGYRIRSLSVSGDPKDPRYAAVFEHREGPAWIEEHGLNASELSTHSSELNAKGYMATQLSATGADGSVSFAAVFELGADTRTRWDLAWCNAGDANCNNTLQSEHNRAHTDDYIPVSNAIYGNYDERRYAAVWTKNTQHVAWSSWSSPEDKLDRYHTQLMAAGTRPALLSLSQDDVFTMLYVDDQLPGWELRHNLDTRAFSAELKAQKARGRYPITLASGGFGTGLKYAAVFADVTASAPPREDRVDPPSTERSGTAELDAAMVPFMKARGIRAGSVAFGREGRVTLARAYTNAEADYPLTTPETRFRIGRLSAIFTAAEISALVRAGTLAFSTPAFGAAGVTTPLPESATVDPAASEITVEQLVRRVSRVPAAFGDSQRNIARSLGITRAPLSRSELVSYLYGMPLSPAESGDSAPGLYLLTSVIENSTGLTFEEALTRDVLTPLGISDVSVGNTAHDARQPGEVSAYESAYVTNSQVDFTDGALAPVAYGAHFVLEPAAGALGLVTSAPTLVEMIGHYPVWPAATGPADGSDLTQRTLIGQEPAVYAPMEGTTAVVISHPDGFDIAILFNRKLSGEDIDQLRGTLESYAQTWLLGEVTPEQP
jgi:CubicO group peptidase (beta-lactamase class C family)